MRQTLLTILLIAVLIAAGFVWFRYVRTAPPLESARVQGVLGERLDQYRRLKNLSPDTGIFTDPLFLDLKSAGGAIPASGVSNGQPIQTGRNNPFSF